MNLLYEYKQKIINLSENNQQHKFLNDIFSRWYFNASRKDLIPTHNIINKKDLIYANKIKYTKFNIKKFIKETKDIYMNLYTKSDNQERFHINDNDKIHLYEKFMFHEHITHAQLKHLQDIYTGNSDEFYKLLNQLISIYNFIGIDNTQLSIPPIFRGVELFGSPLNTRNKEYCSPFEIEKNFGSLGSFWDYKLHKDGIYLCNPPFDETFINKMVNRLIENISTTKYKVLIIITIPIWDSISQQNLGVCDYGLDFDGFNKLLNSTYFKEHKILDKYKFPYWNYYTEELCYVCWTHLIILSNLNNTFYKKNFNIKIFTSMWKNFNNTI